MRLPSSVPAWLRRRRVDSWREAAGALGLVDSYPGRAVNTHVDTVPYLESHCFLVSAPYIHVVQIIINNRIWGSTDFILALNHYLLTY